MARLTSPSLLELDLGMELALIIGPTTEDPFSDEDLRIAWQHHRAEERVDALIEYDIEPWFSSPRTATSGMTSWRRCESEPTRPSCGSAPAVRGSRAASRGVRVQPPTTAGTWSPTMPLPSR